MQASPPFQWKGDFLLKLGTKQIRFTLDSSDTFPNILSTLVKFLGTDFKVKPGSDLKKILSDDASSIISIKKGIIHDEISGRNNLEGYVHSSRPVARLLPESMENDQTIVKFSSPGAISYDLLTLNTEYQLYKILEDGQLQEIALNPLFQDQRSILNKLVEAATSPITEFLEQDAKEQENCGEMEVEEETKGKITEHECQTEETATTANTVSIFSEYPSDISDGRIKLEKENEKLKTETLLAANLIASLQKENRVMAEKISEINAEKEKIAALQKQNAHQISRLETENQAHQSQVLSLQKQLEAHSTQLKYLQTKYAGLESSRVAKRKKVKLNSGEPLESDRETLISNQEKFMSVEPHSFDFEEQKQTNTDTKLNPGNRTKRDAEEAMKQKVCKDIRTPLPPANRSPNPIIQSAIESLAHSSETGLSAGVIDLFIKLSCINELPNRSNILIYESTKWDTLSSQEIMPADYDYKGKRSILYPLHLRLGDKQYWALLILKNSKRWDHTANTGAYYVSSLANDQPPKDLLQKVLTHISNSVKKRLDKKKTKESSPLGNILLQRIDVAQTNRCEETGFHLLNWLLFATVNHQNFTDHLVTTEGYPWCLSTDEVVEKWKVSIYEHLNKHLYEPTSLEIEKRPTRATKKLEAESQSNFTQAKYKNKVA